MVGSGSGIRDKTSRIRNTVHRVYFLIHKIGFKEHASGKLTPNEIDITARLQTGTLK
jgi:hypothetical protein